MLELYRFFKESTFFKHRTDGIASRETPNRNFVFVDFPEKYLEAVEQLLYPKWYTACFMAEGHNSSAWGHYGDSHKGVCLIFEGKGIENEYSISLFGKNGWGKDGATFGYRNHQFYKINYEEGFGDIDFFKSIGRLSVAKNPQKVFHTMEKHRDLIFCKSVLRDEYCAIAVVRIVSPNPIDFPHARPPASPGRYRARQSSCRRTGTKSALRRSSRAGRRRHAPPASPPGPP